MTQEKPRRARTRRGIDESDQANKSNRRHDIELTDGGQYPDCPPPADWQYPVRSRKSDRVAFFVCNVPRQFRRGGGHG